MKFFNYFFLALLTITFCIYLSYFFDSSNYLTAAFAKSKIISFPILTTIFAVNLSQPSNLVQQGQALYEAGLFHSTRAKSLSISLERNLWAVVIKE